MIVCIVSLIPNCAVCSLLSPLCALPGVVLLFGTCRAVPSAVLCCAAGSGIPEGLCQVLFKVPCSLLRISTCCMQEDYKPDADHIVTAASCTTNCLAPVVKVVHEKFGIKHGCITTIHNLTNTQTIVDAPNTKKSDLRRAR